MLAGTFMVGTPGRVVNGVKTPLTARPQISTTTNKVLPTMCSVPGGGCGKSGGCGTGGCGASSGGSCGCEAKHGSAPATSASGGAQTQPNTMLNPQRAVVNTGAPVPSGLTAPGSPPRPSPMLPKAGKPIVEMVPIHKPTRLSTTTGAPTATPSATSSSTELKLAPKVGDPPKSSTGSESHCAGE